MYLKTEKRNSTGNCPILFITDFTDVCPDTGSRMYADDTVVYISVQTCDLAEEKLIKMLVNLSHWQHVQQAVIECKIFI